MINIEICIMQSDYTIRSFGMKVVKDISVSGLYSLLINLGHIRQDATYGMSVFGDRVKMHTILQDDDRFELSLPLPSDPMQRRRKLALKRKNK